MTLKPEILCHPHIPKPLHGMNPRTIMGQEWWDKTIVCKKDNLIDRMKIPKRKGLISTPMPKDAEEVKSVVRVGGYYYWSWKFPFRHFEKERLLIATKNCVYEATL